MNLSPKSKPRGFNELPKLCSAWVGQRAMGGSTFTVCSTNSSQPEVCTCLDIRTPAQGGITEATKYKAKFFRVHNLPLGILVHIGNGSPLGGTLRQVCTTGLSFAGATT